MAKPVLIIWLGANVNAEVASKLRERYDVAMPEYEVIFMFGDATLTYFPSPEQPPIHFDPRPTR